MKKIDVMFKCIIVLVFVAILSLIWGIASVITLCRYAVEDPIAQVRVIKICRADTHYEYASYFANVEIISVSNEDAFKETASKISKDGKRANLHFEGEIEEGEVYDCYASTSLRGRGITEWWSNFDYHCDRMKGPVFFAVFVMAMIGFIVIVKHEERKGGN